MATTNYLEDALQTGVKFYASLTRNQAKGIDSIGNDSQGNPIYVEPGAICFVSDSSGNSIFVNKRLFGDGAISGGGSGGGLTEVNLSDIVVIEADGTTLTSNKTLQDYFGADGKFITDYLIITTQQENSLGQMETVTAISMDSSGIKIGNVAVATINDINDAIDTAKTTILSEAASTAQSKADQALADAKTYTDNTLTSVYKVKGSVQKYDDLASITSPKQGDVYNVINSQGTIGSNNYVPPGTNYVYVDDGTNKYWDPLGGTVDLSSYIKSTEVDNKVASGVTEAKDYTDNKVGEFDGRITANANSINTLSSNYSSLNSKVTTNISDIATNAANIETNTTNITNIATQLTWQ